MVHQKILKRKQTIHQIKDSAERLRIPLELMTKFLRLAFALDSVRKIKWGI